MGQSNSAVGRVHRLTTRTARPERLDPNFGFVNLDVHLRWLWQHRNHDGAGVDSTLRLRRWDPLDAVNARLKLESPVHTSATDAGDCVLQATGHPSQASAAEGGVRRGG